MRIVAGIILIVAATVNALGGGFYLLGGALTTGGMSTDAEMGMETAGTQSAAGSQSAQPVEESKKDSSGTGIFWVVFGLFLWVLFILQIVGAIMLFQNRAQMFIFIVCALSVIAEIVGQINVGFVFWQVFGLVGGVLGIIGARGIGSARGIGKAKAAPPAAPAQGGITQS
ncbi:MAG: hypothetical protein JRF33_16505 [Deltaproteobacteria bacterium]|nr:hypothetical protein [Deltaproteobacteria bacterium]